MEEKNETFNEEFVIGDELPSIALKINNDIKAYLTETIKWGKFLAIMGFIGAGLMIIIGLMMITLGNVMALAFGNGMGRLLGVIYILIAVLYYFPSRYLLDFSNYIKQALLLNDQESLDYAFSRLKSLYKFVGISVIVLLSIYLMVIVFAIFAGVLATGLLK
jgi:hypothetical protein